MNGADGQDGQNGTDGQNGADAQYTVSAVTSLADRADSGHHGNWATDQLTRTATVTRQHAAESAKCGGGGARCWFYTATVADTGTFTTMAGASSPAAGTSINGVLSGTLSGADQFEFYAASDEPDTALVPATVTGNELTTSGWPKLFFPAGTAVTGIVESAWGWTYVAPTTCETWVNSSGGESGDIAGVNQCTGE